MNSTLEEQAGSKKSAGEAAQREVDANRLAQLSLAALGIVFGDIATSPLYAIRECFHGDYAIAVSHANVLGVLSLVFWALMMIVTLKYVAFVLRADNNGEGGVIALTALIKSFGDKKRGAPGLVPLGLFAACLLFGDGMITPAISVLSAVEGIRIITPAFREYVVPLTVFILAFLFLLQRRGTARVGKLFGPVILLWLTVIGILGLIQIVREPYALLALFPGYAIGFLLKNGLAGFLVLGGVFLVVTGAEALYADLGHFGKLPIRLTWSSLVLPALVLNYFGQGALLLRDPSSATNPFYALVPVWALGPMVILATLATIIASQAVITGAFSLARQAIQLGYLPRMKICHTSAANMGQVYVPQINWMLMICTIGLVFGFRSSAGLAAAYGVAVTSTMLITSILFCMVSQKKWGWSRSKTFLLTAVFLLVDITFFSANVSKIVHGAWFPLLIGAIFFIMMLSWEQGRNSLFGELEAVVPTFEDFRKTLDVNSPTRVNGQAAFLTGSTDRVPAALVHNLKHNKTLHSEIAFLHFKTADIPRVPNFEKVQTEKLGGGFYRITATYGFMEEPNITKAFALAREAGVEFRMDNVSFFLGRERLTLREKPKMGRLRSYLFLFMSRNATDAATFFDIPSDRIIEIGVQLEL
ncbi:MAG: potassium transporter Kup [Syntrophobacteraceae bacterium]